MKPEERFQAQSKSFWASVRTLTEKLGYSRHGLIRSYTVDELVGGLGSLDLNASQLVGEDGHPTVLGDTMAAYFQHRADTLNNYVQQRLMDLERSQAVFEQLQTQRRYTHLTPMNKQSGDKRRSAYFTGIINMLLEAELGTLSFDSDPRQLTTVTLNGLPLRTMARRMDGAFPSVINPLAVWEIKEYYSTTSFGSRVSGGVYETLLDGMEIEELREQERIDVRHYLMIDGHLTWWGMGKSYLCRIIDMLHMGYVDEVLFGHEVVEQLPRIVREWEALLETRPA